MRKIFSFDIRRNVHLWLGFATFLLRWTPLWAPSQRKTKERARHHQVSMIIFFTTLWIIVQTSFCGEVGLTHERLYVSYIFEIAKLKHSKCDGRYLPLVTIITQAAPLYPEGPCLTQFMSHTQKTWLVFQSRVDQMFQDFYHHYQCYKNRRWRGSKWSGWANAYPWKPKEIGERFFEHL